MSDMLRITGLATGLDVDSLVKTMIKADTTKVDKAKQDKQIIQWKQDMYRDIIGDLNTLKSSYFDVLKSDANMLSTNNYSSFDITNDADSVLSVSASGNNVIEGTYNVTVSQLASGAYITGTPEITSKAAGYDTKLSDLTGITIPDTITINYSTDNGTTQTQYNVSIDSTDTIYSLKNKISNASNGNVVLNLSELTGKLTLKTTAMGEGITLTAADTVSGDTLSALGLNSSNTTVTTHGSGLNAHIIVKQPGSAVGDPGVDVYRNTNSFTIDGVNYKLSSPGTSSVSVTENVDKTYDKIKAFIDKYNDIIGKINTKVTEKKQYTYSPLTDEQKAEMKDTEITAWETKAKQGLLKGDSNLQNMLYNLRDSFYEKVDGAGIYLTDIGLSTSSDTTQGGKIIIDETKLKDAIKTKGDQVTMLFTKTSESFSTYDPHLSNTERETRTSQEGIFQRINDIIQDNVRTIRDGNGKKGILLEKAGVTGDYTEYNNLLTNQLNAQDKVISTLTKKLSDDQDKYYNQFSKLETAMEKLNQQSSWLTQQLGTS